MPFKDLRGFLATLEKEKELLIIDDEVLPEPEIGALGRAICDLEMEGGAPGVLCRNVRGFRIPIAFCLHASHRRVALSMDMPKQSKVKSIFDEFSRRWDRVPVRPKEVSDGTCKEVKKFGDKINLAELPAVRWNLGDAGPFLTKTCVITKDVETGQPNVGLYRVQFKDRRRLGVTMIPYHDIGGHFRKAQMLGKKMEVAVAIGNPPSLSLASCTPLPHDWDEYSFAGSLNGEPIETTKAETVDLPVPANSEIVIEGEITMDKWTLEGPFGEYPGYYSHIRVQPEIEVKAVTHRENPTFEGLYIGIPWTECDWISHMPNSVSVYKRAKLMVPEIEAFNLASTWCMIGVASMKKAYGGQAKQLMNAIWATPHGRPGMKVLMIVDEDVDPFDINKVLWSMAARFNPGTDVVFIPGATDSPLDPINPGKGIITKMGLDLTWPKYPEPIPGALGLVEPRNETEEWKKRIRSLS